MKRLKQMQQESWIFGTGVTMERRQQQQQPLTNDFSNRHD
eukprot:CAMPEP_0172469696 /NCGR_PEP_ID=MMETSP1065-20121228/64417_1 /TAXON_ID=265537 /ORGANISM="Amphiprora paludosa, Strain CCMP125" /LENGTH=39 /DNA_ID= /DNA_START= /DNA_END= /DNA_ORIENTATION=